KACRHSRNICVVERTRECVAGDDVEGIPQGWHKGHTRGNLVDIDVEVSANDDIAACHESVELVQRCADHLNVQLASVLKTSAIERAAFHLQVEQLNAPDTIEISWAECAFH